MNTLQPKSNLKNYGILLLGIFLISSNFIVGNFGKNIPPWQLTFTRFFIAFLILISFSIPRLKKSWHILKKNWHLLMIYGFLGVTIAGGFAYISLHETTAINGSFIFATSPIFTLIITWLLLREKLTPIQWLGVIITLLGVLIIICKGNIQLLLAMKFTTGDLWMLGNAISWALYTVLIKRWKINVDPLSLLIGMLAMGVLLTIPFCGYEIIHHSFIVIDSKNILTILYAGIFAGALAYAAYLYGVMAVGPARAGLLTYLMPFFATVQAYFILGEALQSYLIPAIVCIGIGISLTMYFDPHREN